MNYYCTTLRKKNCNLTFDKDIKINDEELKVSQIYHSPATYSEEFAQVLMVLEQPYNGKKVLNFRKSWFTKNDADEEECDKLNAKVREQLESSKYIPYELETCISARLHGTSNMSDLYLATGALTDALVSPESSYHSTRTNMDVIFCERVTSYTKSFDMTIVYNDGKHVTHSCVDRKNLKVLSKWAEELKLELYTTGPDPLPWKQLKAYRETNTWNEINAMLNPDISEEDESSEWEQGETEESEEDIWSDCSESDLSDLSEDDEPLPKRRRT